MPDFHFRRRAPASDLYYRLNIWRSKHSILELLEAVSIWQIYSLLIHVTIMFLSIPISSTSSSATSPDFRYFPISSPQPRPCAPEQVPEPRNSPGYGDPDRHMYSMRSSNVQQMSARGATRPLLTVHPCRHGQAIGVADLIRRKKGGVRC